MNKFASIVKKKAVRAEHSCLSEELDLIVKFACFFLLFLSSHSGDKVRRLFFQNIGVICGWIV